MKNFIKIIALALVAVIACATLASCALGAPNADPEKAEKSLEKKGYVVDVADDKVSLGLVALSTGLSDLECVITAFNEEDKEDAVMIYYFEDKEVADEAWEKYFEKAAEKVKEDNKDVIVKKSGKMIWVGTKAAINAAK